MRTKLYLTLVACAFCGYFFYKFNGGDPINSIIFAVGLSGIALSLIRNKDQSDD